MDNTLETSCLSLVASNLTRSCKNLPVQGIEQRVLIVNRDDIDRILYHDTQYANELIADIRLKVGKTGYFVDGFKSILNAGAAGVFNDTSENGMTHSLSNLRVWGSDEQSLQVFNQYLSGVKVIAIVERLRKGVDNQDAYIVLGAQQGLTINAATYDANANDGVITFNLATQNNFKEPGAPLILRIGGSYEITRTAVNNRLVAPTVVVARTVTFVVNGGSAVNPISVNDGETLTKPADPIKAGATFQGWHTDHALQTPYPFARKVLSNITLYAKWS